MVEEVDGRWGMNLKDHIAQWYLFYFLRHGLIYGFDSMPRRFEVIPMGIKKTQDYRLTIKPAIKPEERHKIQDALKKLGYKVHGGGTDTDISQCIVSFSK